MVHGVKNLLISLWSYRLIRVALGVVFVWAGLVKLADPEGFAEIIAAYELVPEDLLVPVAVGLPVLEVLGGLGLIFDVPGSLSIISWLLILFVFVLWFGILKNLDIDCGCFSPEDLKEHGTLRAALYRDLVMFAGVFYLFWWRRVAGAFPQRALRSKALQTG